MEEPARNGGRHCRRASKGEGMVAVSPVSIWGHQHCRPCPDKNVYPGVPLGDPLESAVALVVIVEDTKLNRQFCQSTGGVITGLRATAEGLAADAKELMSLWFGESADILVSNFAQVGCTKRLFLQIVLRMRGYAAHCVTLQKLHFHPL